MPTLEEAGRCPKCQQPGVQGKTLPTQEIGKKVIMFTCETKSCRWYNTGWPVQINADGTIPVTFGQGDKAFGTPPVVSKTEADLNIARANRDAARWDIL
jgi:hypothetical protein